MRQRTPEEIKRGVACCKAGHDGVSIGPRCNNCPYDTLTGTRCMEVMLSDLEKYVARLEHERDLAVNAAKARFLVRPGEKGVAHEA